MFTNIIFNNEKEAEDFGRKSMKRGFDHKFVENVFPEDFYQELIKNTPEKSHYTPIVETGSVSPGYSPERFIFNLFDKKLIDKLDQKRKIYLVLDLVVKSNILVPLNF